MAEFRLPCSTLTKRPTVHPHKQNPHTSSLRCSSSRILAGKGADLLQLPFLAGLLLAELYLFWNMLLESYADDHFNS